MKSKNYLMNEHWPFAVNLGNSIIGVAILTMPFCFKQCGIILGFILLLFCTWLTLASCQLLMKAGIVSHHRSYEFLAYHAYGLPMKVLVEICMIGMQLGTLVAQIVVIGDLGPPIIVDLFGFEGVSTVRCYVIVILCLFVGLPLGLIKDLRNVSQASAVCMSFYAAFSVYVVCLSSGTLFSADWFNFVNFWRPEGIFKCLPILSFSFGCQTQLFILYNALPEPSLHAIKTIIRTAVSLCSFSYLLVGFFGYLTFYEADVPGDVLTIFNPGLGTVLVKLGFVLSIAITFPVIIFPCRASIYTLLFQGRLKYADDVGNGYIPEVLFKSITIVIIVGSMVTAILIPNVEFILGLSGAVTGSLICYVFPAFLFLRVMSSRAEGKTVAQIVLLCGLTILLSSTFTTMYHQDHVEVSRPIVDGANKMNVLDAPPPGQLDGQMKRNADGDVHALQKHDVPEVAAGNNNLHLGPPVVPDNHDDNRGQMGDDMLNGDGPDAVGINIHNPVKMLNRHGPVVAVDQNKKQGGLAIKDGHIGNQHLDDKHVGDQHQVLQQNVINDDMQRKILDQPGHLGDVNVRRKENPSEAVVPLGHNVGNLPDHKDDDAAVVEKVEGKGGGEALPKMEAGSHGDPVAHQDTILEALEVQRREQAKLIREQKVLLQELKEHNKQNQEFMDRKQQGDVEVSEGGKMLHHVDDMHQPAERVLAHANGGDNALLPRQQVERPQGLPPRDMKISGSKKDDEQGGGKQQEEEAVKDGVAWKVFHVGDGGDTGGGVVGA